MSIGDLDSVNCYQALPSIASGSRQAILAQLYIPLFSAIGDFSPAMSIDVDGLHGPPSLGMGTGNWPGIFTFNDEGYSGSGIDITGLEASWFSASAEQTGPHDGSPQGIRTGTGAVVNGLETRLTTLTSDPFQNLRLGTSGFGGSFPGRILNVAVVIGASDAQVDQMRLWGLSYWYDTLPAPYVGLIPWSRRLSTDLTTGIGAGDPIAFGSPTISNVGDPVLTAFASGKWSSDGRGAF